MSLVRTIADYQGSYYYYYGGSYFYVLEANLQLLCLREGPTPQCVPNLPLAH